MQKFYNGGIKLNQIEIDLRSQDNRVRTVYIDVMHSGLAQRWYQALTDLVRNNYHLEKNFCFLGFAEHDRSAEYICNQINHSIAAINASGLDYQIDNWFDVNNTIAADGDVDHDKMNWLHRYFEDLQGTSGAMSPLWQQADSETKWHIRQLNLLCHEYESLVLSLRKMRTAPEWRRPSQLMCWLNAPRFRLEPEDYELFGVETINRSQGGVFVGVNKAVGKHHWEVFNDEGRDSRIGELVTTGLRTQTEAAGDFDIEWGRDPAEFVWQQRKLAQFRQWLLDNGFDPEDKSLTIGHPKVAQVDLVRSFGSDNYDNVWQQLADYLDVWKIRCGNCEATYNYRWSDKDFVARQIAAIQGQQYEMVTPTV